MEKFIKIVQHAFPIFAMIAFIPLIQNDYLLTAIYAGIILVSFSFKHRKHELVIFLGGFVFMLFSELLFTSTGVESFNRVSLFGLMPLWLPFLWGYGFVVIRRTTEVLSQS